MPIATAELMGYGGIDFTDWLVLKILIKIYGEEKLMVVLKQIQDNGGVENIKMRGFQ